LSDSPSFLSKASKAGPANSGLLSLSPVTLVPWSAMASSAIALWIFGGARSFSETGIHFSGSCSRLMGRDRRSGGCDGRLLLHAAACRIGDSADCHCRTRGCALAIQRHSSPRRAAARARVRACTRAAATRGGANCCPATAAGTCAHARIDAANRSSARTGNRSRGGSRERTGIARCSAAAAAIASPVGAARQRRVAPAAAAAIDRL
jgi:hypothetical protein